ncbi:MAG: DUF1361 domain-containing protein [Chitinophagaceae bacterium]|nr:DUF1361 domain-containing protein [Chitinophagaceae bacterium]
MNEQALIRKQQQKTNLSFTLEQWLLLSSCFSCLLLAIRMAATGTFTYIFLPWNLFLAFIPYFFSGKITKSVSTFHQKILFGFTFLAWLVFVPNCFYIITDLFHLKHFTAAPEWFDLLLIFSFAWNGIILGILSLRRVEVVVEKISKKKLTILLVFGVMLLNAFGIYIGRFLRFNSWDIITDPFTLLIEIMNLLTHPFQNSTAWAMIVCYAIFMTFLYYTIRKMSEIFIK